MVNDTGSTAFRPTPDTVTERLGDELVLIHMKTDRMFVLNGTGARVWELLSSGLDLEEIQRRVLQEFEATEAEIAADIQEFIALLRSEQLISADD